MRRHSSSEHLSSVFGIRQDQDSGSAPDLSQSLSISLARADSKLGKTGAEAPANASDGNLAERMQAMMWVAERLASTTNMDDLYSPVLDALFEVFPHAERGFLLLGATVEQLSPQAMKLRHADAGETSVSSSLCAEAMRRREVMVYTEGDNDSSFDQGMSLVSLNIRSAMVAPLLVQEQVLGLMVIDTSHQSSPFNQKDMELAAAVCHQVAVAIKHHQSLAELIKQQAVRENLSRFLPKPVVDQALKGQVDIKLGGERYDSGTVFFADVVGFTKLSEELSPEDIITVMNRFFDRMVRCIEDEQGAIDKFMGDCIMAFWGIPFSDANSALRAALAGLQMHITLMSHNHHAAEHQQPQLGMTVGAEFGPMVAGNVGSTEHVNYTVLGNTVNTAQRIQSQARSGQMLIGQEMWDQLGEHRVGIAMPPVAVKNKAEPVTTYSLRGLQQDNETILFIPCHINDYLVAIIRRLSDGSFVLLHQRECSVDGAQLVGELPEMSNNDFGAVKVLSQLPDQDNDNGLCRSQVSLADQTLNGMLGTELLSCDVSWTQMRRSTATRLPSGQ